MLALKAFGRWITFFVFHMGILFFITTVSVLILFGDRQNVKNVLLDAGVYDSFVDSFLDTAEAEAGSTANSLPYGEQQFREIANQSFTPNSLQNQTEGVINSIYDWVDGSKEELSFTMDLTREASIFIDDVSNYAAERFQTLPACTPEDSVNVTVFELTCQPAAANPEVVRQAAFDDLSQTDFLKDPIITSDTLFEGNKQTPEEQFSFLPDLYRLSKIIPYVAVVVIVLSGVPFVALHRNKRRGLKRIGRDMLTNAVFIMLLTIVFGFILSRYTDTFSVQGGGLSGLLNSVVDGFLNQLDTLVINISLVLGSIGISVLAIERMSRPENLYAGVDKKAGFSSSVPKKVSKKSTSKSKKPPVQTSEEKKKPKKRKKSDKYRKIGL